ncbi:hypothetical protein [Salinarimonas ramus]|uniref:Uncharacterized protein n=1 Tax=Salinarimonas ramus TaxID=690164 RepID=A0A917QKD7_9HYPH|nr:hypothetical protein [Salinarimonas ramus]GGK54834.1 hypothetical protein GCM10011322_47010 [Salinarimonas ramus]
MLKPVLATAAALGLAACATNPPTHLVRAADPAAPSARIVTTAVDAGTVSYRPVQPLDWGDVNRRVAPRR